MSRDDDTEEEFKVYIEDPDPDLSAGTEEQDEEVPEETPEQAAARVTRDLDDMTDALFNENLDDLDTEAAGMVAANVAARLLGKALGQLVLVSNEPEAVATAVRKGLERGVGRCLPMEAVVTMDGRKHMVWVRTVTDRFIETMSTATKIAIAMNPRGTRNGD